MIVTVTEEVTRKEAPEVQCVTVGTQFLLGPSIGKGLACRKFFEKLAESLKQEKGQNNILKNILDPEMRLFHFIGMYEIEPKSKLTG